MVPTGFTSLPTEQSPAIRADSSMSEEMRVSLPITTVGRLPLSSMQDSAHGLPHAEGHVGSEVLPHHAADAVGSK